MIEIPQFGEVWDTTKAKLFIASAPPDLLYWVSPPHLSYLLHHWWAATVEDQVEVRLQ